MKRIMLFTLLLLSSIVFVFAEGGAEETAPEDLAGTTISILSFSTEFNDQGIIADFEERTGINVEMEVVPTENYEAKLRPLLATGTEVPDIFLGEAAFVRQFVEAGYWDTLSEAPYNADTSNMYDYAVEMGSTEEGDVVALTWQTTPGGWFYRRSIAQDVFGVESPEEVAELFSDWDTVLETAETLKENGYAMFPGIGETLFRIFYANRDEAWVNDNNEFVIDDQIKEYFRVTKTVRDMGYDAKLADWSGPWFEEMNTAPGDANVFVYGFPTWGLQFVISGQENSSGDWAVTAGPGPFFWGGTWLGIYEDAPATNKAAAWEFIKMLTQDEEYMTMYAKRSEDFLSNKEVMEEVVPTMSSPVLDGQNHFDFFAEAAEEIDGSTIKGYDYQINQILSQVMNEYLEGGLGYEDALQELTKRVLEAYPRLTAAE
ncbi:extracellular solute-binding protein [Salinispira pacifica]|uniref:ABC-type sugar transport system, periplasmic component n=1 Tax=Salinispira pacifica TaxID=1307761 RepID=V5WG89_9SPIO|nr:ABC transporter substrate-binding protein [Salinispira pacifica]AHC14181.1 ABC-type sugar transport system, periplasmic component [Salinispira pacifica]